MFQIIKVSGSSVLSQQGRVSAVQSRRKGKLLERRPTNFIEFESVLRAGNKVFLHGKTNGSYPKMKKPR